MKQIHTHTHTQKYTYTYNSSLGYNSTCCLILSNESYILSEWNSDNLMRSTWLMYMLISYSKI